MSRINNFDFLRLFLAILVIFSHSFTLALGSETAEPFNRLTNGQATGGYIAVNFFFIMSGYLITTSFFRSSGALDFLGKRVKRIYPGFIAAMLFGALFIVPAAGGYLAGDNTIARFNNLLGHLWRLQEPTYIGTFTHNAYAGAINGSAWTIVFEFWCYIGVLLLGIGGILSNRKMILNIFAASMLFSAAFAIFHPAIYGGWLGRFFGYPALWARLLPLFMAGVVACLFRDRIKYNWIGSLASLSAFALSCRIPNAFGVLFPIAGAYLLFWLAFHPRIRLFNAAAFGDLSYGAYLFAFPIQQLIVSYSKNSVQPLALFATATPAVLLAALTNWHLIERPFLQSTGQTAQIFLRRLQAVRLFFVPRQYAALNYRISAVRS